MITRTAIFEGRVKAGCEERFFKAVKERLAPLWYRFPDASNVRLLRIDAADADAPPIAMIQQIDYPSVAALEAALASPIRAEARAITLELLSMFDGRFYHVVSGDERAERTEYEGGWHTAMMDVAVIGVGVMGSAIAGRLLDVGARVGIYDPHREKCAALVARGARIAPSARDAAVAATFVITSLNSAAIVEHAVFGSDGIAAAATADKLLVDMSSIDPKQTALMAERLLEETGMGWVDAPLSGGAPAVAKGELTLMVGGDPLHVARAEVLLSRLSNHCTHLGGSGSGQTVKLVNQILCACNFMAVAEAVRFAESRGVDAAKIPQALAGGRADSRIMQEFMAKMANRDFSPTGRIDNMLKDLETVQAVALERRIPMPLVSLIADLHRMLVAAGLGPADSAEYVRVTDLATDKLR